MMDWLQILGVVVIIALYAIVGGTIAVLRLRARQMRADNDNLEPEILEAQARDFEQAARFTC
jgi:hypothetical protein